MDPQGTAPKNLPAGRQRGRRLADDAIAGENGDGCKHRLSLAIAGLQHVIGARKHLRGPTRQGGPPRRMGDDLSLGRCRHQPSAQAKRTRISLPPARPRPPTIAGLAPCFAAAVRFTVRCPRRGGPRSPARGLLLGSPSNACVTSNRSIHKQTRVRHLHRATLPSQHASAVMAGAWDVSCAGDGDARTRTPVAAEKSFWLGVSVCAFF